MFIGCAAGNETRSLKDSLRSPRGARWNLQWSTNPRSPVRPTAKGHDMSILMMVLLLSMCVKFGRALATRRRCSDELPADYGMNPGRPWERRPRGVARQP